MMSVTAVDVRPGEMVRLRFENLPANVDFAIKMGASGTGGAGGPTVAHVSSSDGSMVVAWIEILSDVASNAVVDVRVDNGAGLSMRTSFVNSSAFVAPVVAPIVTPVVTPVVTTTGAGGAVTPVAVANRTMKVLHVQRGGIVQVAITGLPVSTSFKVTLGALGTKGFGGYEVGHLDTIATSGPDTISTFEIPVPLHDNAAIDLRLEAPGIIYVVTFNNADF